MQKDSQAESNPSNSNESPSQLLISFEGLLTNSNGEEAWFAQELHFDSEDEIEFKRTFKVLKDLENDSCVRNLKVIHREVKPWLI